MNFSGHFLMVIMNSAETVGQLTQGMLGEALARLSEHCSVSGQGVRGEAPARLSEHCLVPG